MSAQVLMRQRTPSHTVGRDGIPDYITAVRGDPLHWCPRAGYRLEVRCNGHLLRFVIEADRAKGWVVTKKMLDTPNGFAEVPGKEMLYAGTVTFAVVKAERGQVQ